MGGGLPDPSQQWEAIRRKQVLEANNGGAPDAADRLVHLLAASYRARAAAVVVSIALTAFGYGIAVIGCASITAPGHGFVSWTLVIGTFKRSIGAFVGTALFGGLAAGLFLFHLFRITPAEAASEDAWMDASPPASPRSPPSSRRKLKRP
jgi:hypothetical protein